MSLPYRPNPTNHYHNYNLNRANIVMTSKERNQGLREARSTLLENYEKSKEEFLRKEEEKARKKLIAKLERYKGIGEVGNKLGECSLNREDLNSVRQRQQQRYTFESDLHYAENHLNDLEIQKEKERKKLIAKLERYKGIGEIGDRLGEGSSSSEKLNVVRKEQQKSCSSKSYSHFTENGLTDSEIQKEKDKKRLIARLERYKGFDEVGNKLGEGPSNREELNIVREKQQERYSSKSNSHSAENHLTDMEIQKEKEKKKLIAKLERYKNIGEVGNKLGNGSSNIDDLNAVRQKPQEEYSIENNFNDLETKENEEKKCKGVGEPGNKVVEAKELNIAQHEWQNINMHQAATRSSSNTCSTSTSKDEAVKKLMEDNINQFYNDLAQVSINSTISNVNKDNDNPSCQNVVSNDADGASASENDFCFKLGGKNDFVRGKGDHPLLARLSGKKK